MFLSIVAAINLLALLIALINFLTIRKPRNSAICNKKTAVIVPVRNEIAHIEKLLHQLTTQVGLANFQIIIVDDHSTDGTTEFLSTINDPRITKLSARPLPDGWLGKPNALHTAFDYLPQDTEVVIAVDADVRFAQDALVKSVNALNKADFISIYPQQIATSFSERLIQPLLPWSWMSSVVVRLAERFPHPSTAIANGQCMVYRYSSLAAIGGFTSISAEVLDDIALAKHFLNSNFRGHVVQGAEIVSTRMYTNWSEIKSGYGKSLYPTFKVMGSIALAALLIATSISPFISLIWASKTGLIACAAIIGTRILSGISARNRIIDSLLHPLSIAALILLFIYSYRYRGSIQWKGRVL